MTGGDAAAEQPIGVFDSGVGGLTVVAALRRRLPAESILYLGDTARLPYGTKSAQTVRRYAGRNLAFLADHDVKGVVIACNTASAVDLDVDLGVPLWRVIQPGAAVAAQTSQGRVGVIATESTIESGSYQRQLRRLRPELEVWSRACPLFVPLVEEGWHDDPIAEQIVERYLAPARDFGVDTLVLGCTHYPLLEPILARVMGPEVSLVDSAEAVSDQVATDLAERNLLAADHAHADRFFATDTAARFEELARRVLEDDVHLERVDVVEGG